MGLGSLGFRAFRVECVLGLVKGVYGFLGLGIARVLSWGVARGTRPLGFRRERVFKVKGWGSFRFRASRLLRFKG